MSKIFRQSITSTLYGNRVKTGFVTNVTKKPIWDIPCANLKFVSDIGSRSLNICVVSRGMKRYLLKRPGIMRIQIRHLSTTQCRKKEIKVANIKDFLSLINLILGSGITTYSQSCGDFCRLIVMLISGEKCDSRYFIYFQRQNDYLKITYKYTVSSKPWTCK